MFVTLWPGVHTCTSGEHGCTPGHKVTNTHVLTMVSFPAGPEPTPVPGCRGCRMPPVDETTPADNPSDLDASPARTSVPTSPVPSSFVGSPSQTFPAQTPLTHTFSGHTSHDLPPPVAAAPVQTVPSDAISGGLPGTPSIVQEPTASACNTCGRGSASPWPLAAGAALCRVPDVTILVLGALAVAAV